jgi:superfamily II DNA or RNA helicase
MLEDYLPKQKGNVIELREHQQAALDSLQTMRDQGESIALLYHATGTGKTMTAVSDAKRLGKRTLFLAHTKELITQARGAFEELWDQAETGLYVGEEKVKDAYVVCSSIQSVARNLEGFKPDDFGYIIVDECHHGTADTYRKVLSYFKPEFTLGLTATPDRADGESILEDFKNVAHKMDLQKANSLCRREISLSQKPISIMLGIRKPWYSVPPYTTLRRFLSCLSNRELIVRPFPVQ